MSRCRTEDVPGGVLVIISGEVSPEDNPLIKELIAKRTDAARFIIDLANVPIITTPGLGMLVSIHKCCQERSKKLILTGLSPYVHEIFDLTRLSRIFDIAASREEALAQ